MAELPERLAVEAECRSVIAAAGPAPAADFAVIIERLALHYPESKLTPGEQKQVVMDWRRLMGHLPADILRGAADAYLLSPARFFPTPGQLHKIAEPMWARRQILAKRAKDALELMGAA